MAKKKSKTNSATESQLRSLVKVLGRKGHVIRRENLSRGQSFRVRSGSCSLSGDNILFVDRRLPEDQQLTVLVDYLHQRKIELSDEEIAGFSSKVSSLIQGRLSSGSQSNGQSAAQA